MENESIKTAEPEYLTPLFEVRGYGYENKIFFLGIDIGQVATEFSIKLEKGEKKVSMELDLRNLANEFYKDKANSGLIIR